MRRPPAATPRDYTGSAATCGTLQVAIRVLSGKITDAWAVSHPPSTCGERWSPSTSGTGFTPEYDTILAEAIGYLRQVDAWFSTYRVHTPITMYRNGLIELSRLNQVAELSLRSAAS